MHILRVHENIVLIVLIVFSYVLEWRKKCTLYEITLAGMMKVNVNVGLLSVLIEYISIYQSINPFIYLSIYQSIHLSIYLAMYLSIYLHQLKAKSSVKYVIILHNRNTYWSHYFLYTNTLSKHYNGNVTFVCSKKKR